MTKLAVGQGYSATNTPAQIIESFIRKFGYAPVPEDQWTRNRGGYHRPDKGG